MLEVRWRFYRSNFNRCLHTLKSRLHFNTPMNWNKKKLPFFFGSKLIFSHQNSTIVILEKFIHLKTKIEPRRKRAYTQCVNHYFGFLVFIVSFFIIELCERGVCKCVLIRVRCTYAHFITNKSRENRGYMAHDHGHNSVFMISNSNRKD